MKKLNTLLMIMHNNQTKLEKLRNHGHKLIKQLELDSIIYEIADEEIQHKVIEFQVKALDLSDAITECEMLIENNDDFIKAEILNLN
jgi:hypothetical protein